MTTTTDVTDLIEEIGARANKPMPKRIECFVSKYEECANLTDRSISNKPWHLQTRRCMKFIVRLARTHPDYHVPASEFPLQLFADIGTEALIAMNNGADVPNSIEAFLKRKLKEPKLQTAA